MPRQPKRKSASSRPGPKPVVPTNGERRLVTLAVSIGMTVDQIAAVINMSRRTVYRVFADDLANGHARRLLRSAARLEEMAEAWTMRICAWVVWASLPFLISQIDHYLRISILNREWELGRS